MTCSECGERPVCPVPNGRRDVCGPCRIAPALAGRTPEVHRRIAATKTANYRWVTREADVCALCGGAVTDDNVHSARYCSKRCRDVAGSRNRTAYMHSLGVTSRGTPIKCARRGVRKV